MKAQIVQTGIHGCVRLHCPAFEDTRGSFVKVFHAAFYEQHELPITIREEYYSLSRRDVLRGMHFQVPPYAHTKLVCCASGVILDAVVDLRIGSPTYGCHRVFQLDGTHPEIIYIPPGLAHGYRVLSSEALVLYKVSSEYAPGADVGIHWNSCGIDWGNGTPIVSERDHNHPHLADFQSPFVGKEFLAP